MSETQTKEESPAEEEYEQEESEAEALESEPEEAPAPVARKQTKPRTMARSSQHRSPTQVQRLQEPQEERKTGGMGGRTGAIRESRIKDRPAKVGEKDSSLKIKIELDLEVEVDLYARVKGDVVIGLM